MAKITRDARRPKSVPPEAKREGRKWVLVPLDEQGRRHGLAITWRQDGTRWWEETYAAGLRHGGYIEYYASGEVRLQTNYLKDEEHGIEVAYRSERGAGGALPALASRQVWRYQREMRNGTCIRTRAFDRAGLPITLDGRPVPDRPPPGVPTGAWFESSGWLLGEHDGEGRPHGAWSMWTVDGRRRERARRPRDHAGEVLSIPLVRVWRRNQPRRAAVKSMPVQLCVRRQLNERVGELLAVAQRKHTKIT